MSKYRINVRFDLDKPTEAKAAQYLQSLDKSRNAFMVTAVLNEMQRQTSTNGVLLDDIRQVIREELQEVSFAAAPPVFAPNWLCFCCKYRDLSHISAFWLSQTFQGHPAHSFHFRLAAPRSAPVVPAQKQEMPQQTTPPVIPPV